MRSSTLASWKWVLIPCEGRPKHRNIRGAVINALHNLQRSTISARNGHELEDSRPFDRLHPLSTRNGNHRSLRCFSTSKSNVMSELGGRHCDEAQAPGTTCQYDRSVVSREMSCGCGRIVQCLAIRRGYAVCDSVLSLAIDTSRV